MDLQKLNGCIDKLKKDVGDGLVAVSIVAVSDGQAIAEHNSNPAAAALFLELTDNIIKMLKKGPYPALGKYYLLDLAGDKMILILPLGAYQMGIAVDALKIKLGLLLNVIVPETVVLFEEALNS